MSSLIIHLAWAKEKLDIGHSGQLLGAAARLKPAGEGPLSGWCRFGYTCVGRVSVAAKKRGGVSTGATASGG